MLDAVIKVENLSKRYRIGQYFGGRYQYRALRDVLTDVMYAPFRRLRARSKQQAVSSNPTAMSHQQSANFIWALKDVSFQVKQGEVVGIIGRNGAGKTTLLKVLSRITEPTQGRAEIKGRIQSLLEVGTGFHPELTGRENVYLSGAILGMTKKEIERKFDEIVDFSGVEKFIDTPVKRYSSGMVVRLGFAVAAHLEPEILLVDEVLAVGDVVFQKKCLGKMQNVSKEGRTVLFVSHNMGAIQRLCPRSLLLESGVLTSDDGTQRVIQDYLSFKEEKQSGNNFLESLPRRNELGTHIRFTKCLILDSNGEVNHCIGFGEPFSIYLEALARRELQALSVIVAFDSFFGERITTVASEDSGILFSTSPTTALRVHVHMDKLVLKPGVYHITLGIRSGRRGLDHLLHVKQLEILEISSKGERSDAETRGLIHTTGQWKHLQSTPGFALSDQGIN